MQTQTLYEKDFYAWIYHNIELVRSKKWDEIDPELLIEELESMAKRDRHELIGHLAILIAHLLKWQFQFRKLSEKWQEFDGRSWKRSIIEQRDQVESQLQMSPSLKSYFDDAIQMAYSRAVKIAEKETQLPVKTFPTICPYSIEQLLDDDFYPESE
ncbi:MAG: DUF29 domain-containing protein [Thiotrichaceae bacterium]|nr:DUF29 domain-containing protein [Thiotrichaceae bacterium]